MCGMTGIFMTGGKTSAQIVTLLYEAICQEAAPKDVLILGCNTIGHLGAGPDASEPHRRRHQRPHLGAKQKDGRQYAGVPAAPARRFL